MQALPFVVQAATPERGRGKAERFGSRCGQLGNGCDLGFRAGAGYRPEPGKAAAVKVAFPRKGMEGTP